MKIITKKQVEETVEVEIKTPSFYKDMGVFYSLTENCILIVSSSSICSYKPDDAYFSKIIEGLQEYKKSPFRYTEVTKDQFNEKFAQTIENIWLLAGISNVPTLQLQD